MRNRGRPASVSTANNPAVRKCLIFQASDWDYLEDAAKKWGGSVSAYNRMLVRADNNSNFADDVLIEREIKEHEAAITLRRARLQENADKREKKLKDELSFRELVESEAALFADKIIRRTDDLSTLSRFIRFRCTSIKEKHNFDISDPFRSRLGELLLARDITLVWDGPKLIKTEGIKKGCVSEEQPVPLELAVLYRAEELFSFLEMKGFVVDSSFNKIFKAFCDSTGHKYGIDGSEELKNGLTDELKRRNKKVTWDGIHITEIKDVALQENGMP